MLNETKTLKTHVVNGRVVLLGASWKWGPRFTTTDAKTTVNQAKPN